MSKTKNITKVIQNVTGVARYITRAILDATGVTSRVTSSIIKCHYSDFKLHLRTIKRQWSNLK